MSSNSGGGCLSMIGVFAFAAFLLFSASQGACVKPDPSTIENYARDYARQIGWGEVKGIQVAGTDSDGDGYVSVTIRTFDDVEYDEEGNVTRREVVTHAIQCGYGRRTETSIWRKITGCKAAVGTEG